MNVSASHTNHIHPMSVEDSNRNNLINMKSIRSRDALKSVKSFLNEIARIANVTQKRVKIFGIENLRRPDIHCNHLMRACNRKEDLQTELLQYCKAIISSTAKYSQNSDVIPVMLS